MELPDEIISLILLYSDRRMRFMFKIARRKEFLDPWTLSYDNHPEYLSKLGYIFGEVMGNKVYALRGLLHRVGGPAATHSDGIKTMVAGR